MADRRVTCTGKDSNGNIVTLGGSWGSVSKTNAIAEIELGLNTYYVQDSRGRRAEVRVVNGPPGTGKYLRSDPDSTYTDNLDNLPDC